MITLKSKDQVFIYTTNIKTYKCNILKAKYYKNMHYNNYETDACLFLTL